MNIVGNFQKVSVEEYLLANADANMTEEALREEYDRIILPRRMTNIAAGYDFYLPRSVDVTPGEISRWIYTGIKVYMDPEWALLLFPRSGKGFSHGLGLANTVGVIDPDYVKADNEGHIAARLTTMKPIHLEAGDRFMQGVFVRTGLAIADLSAGGERTGGFGSTGV